MGLISTSDLPLQLTSSPKAEERGGGSAMRLTSSAQKASCPCGEAEDAPPFHRRAVQTLLSALPGVCAEELRQAVVNCRRSVCGGWAVPRHHRAQPALRVVLALSGNPSRETCIGGLRPCENAGASVIRIATAAA